MTLLAKLYGISSLLLASIMQDPSLEPSIILGIVDKFGVVGVLVFIVIYQEKAKAKEKDFFKERLAENARLNEKREAELKEQYKESLLLYERVYTSK